MKIGAEITDDTEQCAGKEEKHFVDQREGKADGHADDKCDDLVACQR